MTSYIYNNYGSILCPFRDRRRFPSKIATFSHPHVFAPPPKGFPLEFGTGQKKLEWQSYRAEKEIWRYFYPSVYNPPTCRTEGQTYTGRQQRPRLQIASRGKNRWTLNWDSLSRHERQQIVASATPQRCRVYRTSSKVDFYPRDTMRKRGLLSSRA